jgi:hypothetical protein
MKRRLQQAREYVTRHREFLRGVLLALIVVAVISGTVTAFVFDLPQEGARIVGTWAVEEYWRQRFKSMSVMEIIQSPRVLTFDAALAIMTKLDRYSDQASPFYPGNPNSTDELYALSIEVVPYFSYEGISDSATVDGPACVSSNVREVYPLIDMAKFAGRENFHIGGRAQCMVPGEEYVLMNVRYFNRYSPWNSRVTAFSTFVHELAHANGVCKTDDALMEPTTELATTEVMAAMVRARNTYALPPFILHVQNHARDFAWLYAMQNDRMDDYLRAVRATSNNAHEEATWARIIDSWGGRQEELAEILEQYGKMPYILTIDALRDPDLSTIRLHSLPCASKLLHMNDTYYVVEHMAELVRDYEALLEDR